MNVSDEDFKLIVDATTQLAGYVPVSHWWVINRDDKTEKEIVDEIIDNMVKDLSKEEIKFYDFGHGGISKDTINTLEELKGIINKDWNFDCWVEWGQYFNYMYLNNRLITVYAERR